MTTQKVDANRDTYLAFTRPANTCLVCGTPLNVDGRHPTLLAISDKQEAIRRDFCPTCWNKVGDEEYFSFWVTKRVNSVSAEERRLHRSERNEALWRLFAALYTSETHDDVDAQLFLLAHLLMRYRVLNFAGTDENGKLLFIHPKLGESFAIANLSLDEADFVSVKTDLEKQAVHYVPEIGEASGEGADGPSEAESAE